MAEENINIDSIIQATPVVLDSNDIAVQELALFYLPYSTGFEIECCNKEGVPLSVYDNIPLVMEAPCCSDELRFRIPSGIDGLKALYNISQHLKEHALLNPQSGIHYHVDCSEIYDNLNDNFIAKHSEWILKELDTWGYKGTYNKRICEFSGSRNYTRFKNSTKTMEFRIGEMTFSYELLFKRIVHVNAIVRKLKKSLEEGMDEFYPDNFEDIVKQRIIRI